MFFWMMVVTDLHVMVFIVGGSMATEVADFEAGDLARTIPVWILMLVIGVLGLMLLGLIVFHVYLSCKRTTTYEYLLRRKVAAIEEEEAERQRK